MILASKRRIHRVHHVRSEPHRDPWLWQSKWDIWTSTNTQQMDSGWLIGMLIPNSANWWILHCWIVHLSFSTNQRVQGVLMLSQSHPPHPLGGAPSSYTESVVFFPFIAGASSKNGASWWAWYDSKWRSLENEAFWCTVYNIFGNHENFIKRCCESWTKKNICTTFLWRPHPSTHPSRPLPGSEPNNWVWMQHPWPPLRPVGFCDVLRRKKWLDNTKCQWVNETNSSRKSSSVDSCPWFWTKFHRIGITHYYSNYSNDSCFLTKKRRKGWLFMFTNLSCKTFIAIWPRLHPTQSRAAYKLSARPEQRLLFLKGCPG